MLLTQKIRIFPTKAQENVLWVLSEKCRLIYNFALQDRKTNWVEQQSKEKKNRKYLTYYDQSAELPLIKKKYPEYKWVYSKVLQQVVKKLDENFKSFFGKLKNDDTARPPQFKGKKYFVTLCFNQSGFTVKPDSVSFYNKHPSKIPLVFKLKQKYKGSEKVKQVEIIYYEKKWFVCIAYDYEKPTYNDNGLYQAIDLGITDIVSAVNLDLKFIKIKNRRDDLFWKKHMKKVHSKRDHCKKGSHRWIRYNTTLKRMKRKYANQMKDFQHKISKRIVSNTKANTIIIGDLNVKQMSKHKKGTGSGRKTKFNKTLNHSIHNTGSLSRFSQFLTYKAELLGKKVIRIDESNTTKKCCICGKLKKRSLKERTIVCDCGNSMDRDNNSAVNIMERFLSLKHKYDFLSHKTSVKEESFYNKLGLLRNTALSSPLTKDSGLVVNVERSIS
ncbi:hypothetical protein ES705_18231 [subsurface metagenome]